MVRPVSWSCHYVNHSLPHLKGKCFFPNLQISFIFIGCEFENSIIRLHFFLIFLIFAKFQKDQKLIVMLSIKCLNFKFCDLKLCIKKQVYWLKSK